MNTKTIALTTSALVAFAALATTASAGGAYTGKVSLGAGYAWEDYGGENGSAYNVDASFLKGAASVNVPYDDVVNLQFDIAGAASMDNAGTGDNSYYGGFAAAAHLNYRDEQGALGAFMAVGRANASASGSSDYAVFAGGLEGQYFCNMWTLRAQAGYLDSDSNGYLVQQGGFIRGGADYYASSKLKLSGEVGYLVGTNHSQTGDATVYDWAFSIEYLFGKSVPVSTYLEYRGQHSEENYDDGSFTEKVDRDAVNVGVRFYFGGDSDLMKADRTGAGMTTPDIITISRFDY